MATSLDRLRSAISSRYEIERELGHGAMATVYLAKDLSQPGRWHVVAKDGFGAVISTSAFVYFGYNI